MRIFTDSIAIENNESSLFDPTACMLHTHSAHTRTPSYVMWMYWFNLSRWRAAHTVRESYGQFINVEKLTTSRMVRRAMPTCVCAHSSAVWSSCSSICKIIIIDCTQRNHKATRRLEIKDGDSILAWNFVTRVTTRTKKIHSNMNG